MAYAENYYASAKVGQKRTQFSRMPERHSGIGGHGREEMRTGQTRTQKGSITTGGGRKSVEICENPKSAEI